MNLITLHRWDAWPEYFVAEVQQHGKRRHPLGADELEDAVHEAAGLAGLDAQFRDAQGEEWDILIPEQTLFHEFPDWEIDDRWLKLFSTESRTRRARWCGLPVATIQSTPMKRATLKEKPPVGTEGIFYLVPYPQGWRILPVCGDQFPMADFGHADYWEEVVADILAKKWQPTVSKEFPTSEQLREELLPLVYAFPRGRVVALGKKFAVYHGDNLASFMQCDRKAIEACFGIQGHATWELDEHEQCVAHDRDRVRELLRLKETWPAVSVNWD